MDLAERIKQHYFDNLTALPDEKKFHFASRIYSWSADPKARRVLKQLRPSLQPVPEPGGIEKMVDELMADDPDAKAKINAAALRQAYFEMYPDIRSINRVLFRARHLLTVYGVDIRQDIFKILGIPKLDQMAENLRGDDEAIKILSTYAINFLYVYEHLLGGEGFVNLNQVLKIANTYDLRDKTQIQLFLYLLTHCVIGETNFYTRHINPDKLSDLTKLLAVMEGVVKGCFNLINLDNKLEFLVCCKLCGYRTSLFESIYDECERSIGEGGYLIDMHNLNPQVTKTSLEDSEHRNVLYIMSRAEYIACSELVA